MTFSTHYNVGTVSVANGSAAVTGNATFWSENVKAGDILWIGGVSCRIEEVASATSLTLARPWPGADATGAYYEAWAVLEYVGYQKKTGELLTKLSNGVLNSLAGVGGDADQLPMFTGVGTLGLLDVAGFMQGLLAKADAAEVLSELGAASFMQGLLGKADAAEVLDELGVTEKGQEIVGATNLEAAYSALDIQRSLRAKVFTEKSAFVIVGCGQSNMQGASGATNGDKTINPRVFAWNRSTGQWGIATPGVDPMGVSAGNPNNLLWAVAKRLQEATGRDVFFILHAIGGTSIDSWLDPTASHGQGTGVNISTLKAYINAALASPEMVSRGITKLDAVLWHQGENQNGDDPSTYLPKIPFLTSQWREYAFGGPRLPFVAGELLDGGTTSKQTAAYRAYAASGRDPYFGLASSAGLTNIGDGIHFDGAGLVEFGGRYFAELAALPRGGASGSGPFVGSFTPDLSFAVPGTSSFAYGSRSGTFVKIGRLVFVTMSISVTPQITGTGASGNLTIGGLPFLAGGEATVAGCLVVNNVSSGWVWPTSSTSLAIHVTANSNTCNMRGMRTGGNTAVFTAANMTHNTSHILQASGVYLAAA